MALIATADRPRLLHCRSLPSVVGQRLTPEHVVVVVDDSREECNARAVRAVCRRWRRRGVPLHHLKNRRTPGAAGAWNTGLDHLARHVGDPRRTYVAILDDDDAWAPQHLADCLAHATANDLDVVASGFHRIEEDAPPRQVSPPDRFDVGDFLVGNPGIQPSALLVRLATLLEAGCFDEALASCTDRDLCVRIADLGDVRYGAFPGTTATHYACRSRARLCTPGSRARVAGLDAFWRKHLPRMTEQQQVACASRAARYFGWTPPGPARPTAAPLRPEPVPDDGRDPVALIVGFIADAERHANVEALLGDLRRLRDEPGLAGLDVLVLENSATQTPSRRLRGVVERAQHQGLRVHLVDRADHAADAESGVVLDGVVLDGGRLAIAPARTVLQSYLYGFARHRPGAVVWILDDDMRLAPLVLDGGRLVRRRTPIVPPIQRLRDAGVDIAIGAYTGAAPLPFAATVRVQLVDLLATLHWLARTAPDAPLADPSGQNAALRAGRRDFYYDLSRRETDRLESPFLAPPASTGETAGEAFRRLTRQAGRILAGEPVFRPLAVPADADPVDLAAQGLERGGNTLVFAVEALLDAPNVAPLIDGRPTRRSDMLWALLQRRRFRRRVVTVPLGVYHDRSRLPAGQLDVDRVIDDIRGYAVFSALADTRDWSDDVAVTDRAAKLLQERLAAFRLSFHRVRGLVRGIRRALTAGWLSTQRFTAARGRLLRLCADVEDAYPLRVFEAIEEQALALEATAVRQFVRGLQSAVESHRERLRDTGPLATRGARRRADNARAVARRLAAMPEDAGLLGAGGEGVVFHDGRRVFKVFDYWKARDRDPAVAQLAGLVGRWPEATALYPLEAFHQDGPDAVLVYPFEPSQPYRGGHGHGLVELIVECHRYGVACRNIHPDNLRVVGERVRLVDYGSDLTPMTDGELEMMCRRAWLSWRWWYRPDLKELMRRSLTDERLPQLQGYERLRAAVRQAAGIDTVDDPVLEMVRASKPTTVLDYGCGKGEQARPLAADGFEVVAFDPDEALDERLRAMDRPGLRTTGHRETALDAGPYDVVVCRRVLCTIDDEAEAAAVAEDLRAAVKDDGRVSVAFCHPAYAWRQPTPEAVPGPVPYAHPERSFLWSKTVRSTGARRIESHRPERTLVRLLARAGLAVMSRRESETVDLERFEPSADLLVLELAPLAPLPDVTLLVKACAMEAETLETQVQHIVRQTERPRAFAERLLVLDSRTGGFLRQHTDGDAGALRAAADRLMDDGWIDRVIEGPTDGFRAAEVNERWFGEGAPSGHAVTGAQVSSTLAGFDACTTRWVLQADADVMVCREDPAHDYLADMVAAATGVETGVTVSFNIASEGDRVYTTEGPDGPWRTEVRLCLLDLDRLRVMRPLPNRRRGDALEVPWHRSLDLSIRAGRGRSLRGGDRRTFYIHPPNERKRDRQLWWSALDAVERGRTPAVQQGQVDWVGSPQDWTPPERFERFVFVVAGRGVPAGRFRRALDSILRQRFSDWGAIVIDDASSPALVDEMRACCRPHAERVSFIGNRDRRGLLANMVTAIRGLCGDPESVIVTLDADDELLGDQVLDRLAEEYGRGADMTVGSMLRTDKAVHYPVRFEAPRLHRGGNVWQHLRSFKKRLFDAIPDHALRLDSEYVDLANDWAYMLPLVELAESPSYIPEPLYLHEPSGDGKAADRPAREAVIARIVGKPSLSRARRAS